VKINEVMKRTGLSRKAIYIYEDRGFLSPLKNGIGYREYGEGDVERLLFIAKLRELGLSLEEIAQLLQTPEETDILLQKHFERTQRELSEAMQRLSQVQTVLYNLPPNGGLEDLVRAADIAIPANRAIAAARYLSEELAPSAARRLTMHIFETFLDVPLDTPERWEAWYALLETVETAPYVVWEGFEEYYGAMTAEQRYKDYCLRRALVTGYIGYGPEEEKAKGDEILRMLDQLTKDEDYAARWRRYYSQVVKHPLENENLSQQMEVLSKVYHPYNCKFNHVMEQHVYPFLKGTEGTVLQERLRAVLGDDYDMSPYTMIYFDFFNNTLEKLTED
jgi:DNA-binding transcriptional MerR regulator